MNSPFLRSILAGCRRHRRRRRRRRRRRPFDDGGYKFCLLSDGSYDSAKVVKGPEMK